jgi:hypothetical protein
MATLWMLVRTMLHRSRREKIHVGANPGGRPTQLHALLLELIPGGANKDLPAAQAKKLVATVRPRDAVSKTRRRVAAEMIGDLEKIYARSKAADKGLTALIAATTTTLQALHGIGPSGTARLLVDLHIMAVVQLRNQTEGRAQFDRRVAEGKTPMEADARTQTPAIGHRLQTNEGRRATRRSEPGRTPGDDSRPRPR